MAASIIEANFINSSIFEHLSVKHVMILERCKGEWDTDSTLKVWSVYVYVYTYLYLYVFIHIKLGAFSDLIYHSSLSMTKVWQLFLWKLIRRDNINYLRSNDITWFIKEKCYCSHIRVIYQGILVHTAKSRTSLE